MGCNTRCFDCILLVRIQEVFLRRIKAKVRLKRSSDNLQPVFLIEILNLYYIFWNSRHCILTGRVPGSEASKKETSEFGGAMNSALEAENSLVLESIWACISRPTILDQPSCEDELYNRK